MAITDIPAFVRAQAGDLIRSQDWNGLQQQVRESIRTHQHTHVTGTPINDSATVDEAQQIDTNEIANGAVTAPKMAAASVGTSALAVNAVATANIADGAVTTAKIGNNSITVGKLSFNKIANGSGTIAGNGVLEQMVQAQLDPVTAKTNIYFPTLSIIDVTTGAAEVGAVIVYRRAPNPPPPAPPIPLPTDVLIRVTNFTPFPTTVIWQVLTFTS